MPDINDKLKAVLTSTIGKWIAGLFALIVAPVLPAFINAVNNVLGYELSDAQVQSYSQKAALAIAGVIATWLLNRGAFERKALDKVKTDANVRVSANNGNTIADNTITSDKITSGAVTVGSGATTETELFEPEDADPDGEEFVPEDHSETEGEVE